MADTNIEAHSGFDSKVEMCSGWESPKSTELGNTAVGVKGPCTVSGPSLLSH